MTRNPFKTIALGTLAAATAAVTLIPAMASAQGYPQGSQGSYDPRGGYYYNGCQRAQANRSVGGGLAGAAAGAVIGGNVASRKTRDEGAILGGVLGAVIGSQIGKSTAACAPGQAYPRQQQSYDYGYGAYPQQDPYAQPYYGSGYGYDTQPAPSRRDRNRNRDYAYGYGTGDDRARDYDNGYYSSSRGSDPADCRMVESSVRLPDGRVQTRMVQACRDSNGDYQLVQ